MEDFIWVEKYRPESIADCVLPERIKKSLNKLAKQKAIPNLLFSGPPGSGKTASAKALCKQTKMSYLFINSSEERGIDTFRNKVISFASTVSFNGGRKVVILDEADGLTAEAQDALRGIIEKYSSNCTFILTCNFKAKIIEALHSRLSFIDFVLKKEEKPSMALGIFKRISEILIKEQVEFNKDVLIKLVEHYFPDFRKTINEIQNLSSQGDIGPEALAKITDAKEIRELVGYIKEKKWGEMRKWVAINSDYNYSRLFRRIYDNMHNFLKPESIPQCVLILADYQRNAAFAADQEINTVACLTAIMVDCEFKD